MFSDKNNGGKSHGSKLSTLRKADKKVYELITKEHERLRSCDEYHKAAFDALREADGEVYALVNKEYDRTAE